MYIICSSCQVVHLYMVLDVLLYRAVYVHNESGHSFYNVCV